MEYNPQVILMVRGTGRRVLACLAHLKWDVGHRFSLDGFVPELAQFLDEPTVNWRLTELSLGQLARLELLTCRSARNAIFEITPSGHRAACDVFIKAKNGEPDFVTMIPPSLRVTPAAVRSSDNRAPANPFATVAELGARWRTA